MAYKNEAYELAEELRKKICDCRLGIYYINTPDEDLNYVSSKEYNSIYNEGYKEGIYEGLEMALGLLEATRDAHDVGEDYDGKPEYICEDVGQVLETLKELFSNLLNFEGNDKPEYIRGVEDCLTTLKVVKEDWTNEDDVDE